MKKIFSLFLVVAMVFCIAGCGQNATPSDTSSTQSVFEEPEGYAAKVRVEINPIVDLYLDGNGVVLAVDYVNEDAKSWYKGFEKEFVGKNCGESVKTLLDITRDLSPALDNDIKVNVVESVDTVDKKELLGSISGELNDYIAENELDITPVYEIAGMDKTEEFKDTSAAGEDNTSSENLSSDTSSDVSSTTSSDVSSTTSSDVSSEQPPKAPEVVSGAKYMLVKPFEEPEVMVFTLSFNTAEARCSYSDGPYSHEYGEPNVTIQYSGKTYMQAGGKGGSCEYSYASEVYTIADEGEVLKVKLNADGNLVVTECNGFFGGMVEVSAGDIFVKQ